MQGLVFASVLLLGSADLLASDESIVESYYGTAAPEFRIFLYRRANINDPWAGVGGDPPPERKMNLVNTLPGTPPNNTYIFNLLLTDLEPGYYKAVVERKPAGGNWVNHNNRFWQEPN